MTVECRHHTAEPERDNLVFQCAAQESLDECTPYVVADSAVFSMYVQEALATASGYFILRS
jgi:hypothetical protein